MHIHKALAGDDYVGNADPFRSHAHTAAAMLLLVLPALEHDEAVEESANNTEENSE